MVYINLINGTKPKLLEWYFGEITITVRMYGFAFGFNGGNTMHHRCDDGWILMGRVDGIPSGSLEAVHGVRH